MLTFTGRVDEDELTAARRQVTADPAFRADYAWLVDAVHAHVQELRPAWVRERAYDPPTHAPVAIVAASDLAYGFGRMYQILTTGHAAVFRDHDAAVAWLADVRLRG